MNIELYMNRIDLTNFKELHGIELLKMIHRQHLLHIPFENLDMMNGIPLSMDVNDVFEKIVNSNRGGLCFELNSLLYFVLDALNFRVSLISGQFWNADKQTWNPKYSHLALLVELDEQYLFDVGVGGGFLEPLPLRTDDIYSDISGTYRLIKTNKQHSFILQKKNELHRWEMMLKICTKPRFKAQFEPLFIELQHDKDSAFNQKKMISKATADGRLSLTEDSFTITTNGVKTKHPITNKEQWKTLLLENFGIVE